jgi:hypothetical protein
VERTTSTGQDADRTTLSATLPSSTRLKTLVREVLTEAGRRA